MHELKVITNDPQQIRDFVRVRSTGATDYAHVLLEWVDRCLAQWAHDGKGGWKMMLELDGPYDIELNHPDAQGESPRIYRIGFYAAPPQGEMSREDAHRAIENYMIAFQVNEADEIIASFEERRAH